MKKLFLLVCALWLGATWAAGQEYPEWVSEVQQTARQAHQGQLPTDLYRARAARESLYIGLCYDFFMQETSPFCTICKNRYAGPGGQLFAVGVYLGQRAA